jgi:hypothetical protein
MQFQNILGGVVSGSTIEVELLDATETGNVASGASEDVSILAPIGWLYRVRALRLSVGPPPGATSGIHELAVIGWAGDPGFLLLRGASIYSQYVTYAAGQWVYASYVAFPLTPSAQHLAVATLIVDDTVPLVVRYTNDSDVVQSRARAIRLILEKVAV